MTRWPDGVQRSGSHEDPAFVAQFLAGLRLPRARRSRQGRRKGQAEGHGAAAGADRAAGQLVGTVQNYNESDGRFTIKVKLRYIEANQQAQERLRPRPPGFAEPRAGSTLLPHRQSGPASARGAGASCRTPEAPSTPRNFYEVKEKEHNVDIELSEETKVRVANPPAIVNDDKDQDQGLHTRKNSRN